jgi:alkanesulfonate monooxygenase SsuD/methylene tetrahydromethanopterin reductase-like flavin-dependent oxidoreductase (luciferase family)
MKIGLMLPLGADETRGWTDLRAMALAAEEDGLDSVWGADHLIFRDEGFRDGVDGTGRHVSLRQRRDQLVSTPLADG